MTTHSWRHGHALGVLFVSFFLVFQGQVFSADGTSFNPSTVSVVAQSTIPVGTVISWPSGSNPADMPKWLECNGQAVPAGSAYDRLRSVLGGQPVPNFNGQFLRGTTTNAQVGQQVAESVKAHDHTINPYQYTVSGLAGGQTFSASVPATSFSGTVPAKSFSFPINDMYVLNNFAPGGTEAGYTHAEYGMTTSWITATVPATTFSGTTAATSVSGITAGGSITGVTNLGGPGSTNQSGGTETAPAHTKVRYLIRAIQ